MVGFGSRKRIYILRVGCVFLRSFFFFDLLHCFDGGLAVFIVTRLRISILRSFFKILLIVIWAGVFYSTFWDQVDAEYK